MIATSSRAYLVVGGLLAATSTVSAGFSSTMFEVMTDPSAWGNTSLIASLDAQADGFSFNPASGFSAVFANIEIDRTQVSTDVYRMSSPTLISQGMSSLQLNTGDLVFAYRIRLVGAFPGLTVSSMNEVQVIGVPDFGFGEDAMAASLINGQGFVSSSHGRNPDNGNIDDADVFGSSVDFEWGNLDTEQLDNNDFITLLMFTDPAGIGRGVLNMNAPPGQAGSITGIAQADEAPPILIPIVPTPGTILLGTVGIGITVASRRRTR